MPQEVGRPLSEQEIKRSKVGHLVGVCCGRVCGPVGLGVPLPALASVMPFTLPPRVLCLSASLPLGRGPSSHLPQHVL